MSVLLALGVREDAKKVTAKQNKTKQIKQDKTKHSRLFLLTNFSVVCKIYNTQNTGLQTGWMLLSLQTTHR